jgi:Protein of unknown function (DUF3800)
LRIYADESGTHSDEWLVIGMLFVPNHGTLHPELCRVKDRLEYFNVSKKYAAVYKETHFAEFKSPRDLGLGKAWIDCFLLSDSVFRCIVVDWTRYQGRFFGSAFEPDALKKRRAYKKWAEMLLQAEIGKIQDAMFYLDRLRVLYGYDVISSLRDRFSFGRDGNRRRRCAIKEFQLTDSWKDANQCLQLCDLLTGVVFQSLCPSKNPVKLAVMDYLYDRLQQYGVKSKSPGYWRGYSQAVLSKHFPKFSEWFWEPGNRKT